MGSSWYRCVHGEQRAGGELRARPAAQGADAVTAAMDAVRTRLRPVLMTASAMIIGMLPMALGWPRAASRTRRWPCSHRRAAGRHHGLALRGAGSIHPAGRQPVERAGARRRRRAGKRVAARGDTQIEMSRRAKRTAFMAGLIAVIVIAATAIAVQQSPHKSKTSAEAKPAPQEPGAVRVVTPTKDSGTRSCNCRPLPSPMRKRACMRASTASSRNGARSWAIT